MKKKREPEGDSPVEPEKETNEAKETNQAKEARSVPLPPDPADVVPVPVAMSAAEIDERAKVVESLRHERDSGERDSMGDETRPRRGGSATGDEMEEP